MSAPLKPGQIRVPPPKTLQEMAEQLVFALTDANKQWAKMEFDSEGTTYEMQITRLEAKPKEPNGKQ